MAHSDGDSARYGLGYIFSYFHGSKKVSSSTYTIVLHQCLWGQKVVSGVFVATTILNVTKYIQNNYLLNSANTLKIPRTQRTSMRRFNYRRYFSNTIDRYFSHFSKDTYLPRPFSGLGLTKIDTTTKDRRQRPPQRTTTTTNNHHDQ